MFMTAVCVFACIFQFVNQEVSFSILYTYLEQSGDRLKAPQSLLAWSPALLDWVCECMENKGTFSSFIFGEATVCNM